MAYSIQRKDSNHFVPLRSMIWVPSEFLGESFSQMLNSICHLHRGIRLPGEATCERIPRLLQWNSSMFVIQHKFAHRYGVGRICNCPDVSIVLDCLLGTVDTGAGSKKGIGFTCRMGVWEPMMEDRRPWWRVINPRMRDRFDFARINNLGACSWIGKWDEPLKVRGDLINRRIFTQI